MGIERRRRRLRRAEPTAAQDGAPKPATPTGREPARRPSPYDLADLPVPFALTSNVQDPEPVDDWPASRRGVRPAEPDQPHEVTVDPTAEHLPASGDETPTERGLRGLVGGGSSQVSVTAALRARDAARPSEADMATAEAELVIVRRGWIPRDDLPRSGGGPRR